MRQSIVSLLICTLLLGGCATTKPASAPAAGKPENVKEWITQNHSRKKTVIGALAGALAGAATAALTGNDPWTGAAAGAVAGAMAGLVVGKRQDRLAAARDHAVREARYESSQGYVARVESVAFDPPRAKPGQTATISVRYLVVGPNPAEAIKINLFRGLKYGDDYILAAGPNEFTIPRGGGIVDSTMQITLPAKAPQGTYGVEALIEDSEGRFEQVVGTNTLYIVASNARREAIHMASR